MCQSLPGTFWHIYYTNTSQLAQGLMAVKTTWCYIPRIKNQEQKYLAIEIAATQTMSACADCLKTLALRV
jgi:hypothetical protein